MLIRLLIPYSIPSSLSIYSVINKNFAEVRETAYTADNFISMQTEIQVSENTYNHTFQSINDVLPIVILWIIGMAVMFILFALSYKRCHWDINTSLPVNNDFIIHWLKEHRLIRKYAVRVSGNIASPLTFGIFKPIILIPKATEYSDEKQLDFILLHEYVHIRHLDTAVKLIMAAALCIHWFNPFIWVMYILYNKDIELACDESVVLYSGEINKSEYAHMLINIAEKMSEFPPLQSNFSANSIEERIEAIMKIKKMTFKSFTLSLVVITALTTVFATSASASAENKSNTTNKPEVDISYENGYSENIPVTYGQAAIQTTVSGGSWNTTWEQPEAHKCYKANYVNDADCSATVYVKDRNGNVISKKVSANTEDALYVKNAVPGTHIIWIENSNGNIALNGELTVTSYSMDAAGSRNYVIHKFGEDINIKIDNEFCKDIDLSTSRFCKVDTDENTIQYTDENNKDVKLIFNEKIDLNDSDTLDVLLNSISNIIHVNGN